MDPGRLSPKVVEHRMDLCPGLMALEVYPHFSKVRLRRGGGCWKVQVSVQGPWGFRRESLSRWGKGTGPHRTTSHPRGRPGGYPSKRWGTEDGTHSSKRQDPLGGLGDWSHVPSTQGPRGNDRILDELHPSDPGGCRHPDPRPFCVLPPTCRIQNRTICSEVSTFWSAPPEGTTGGRRRRERGTDTVLLGRRTRPAGRRRPAPASTNIEGPVEKVRRSVPESPGMWVRVGRGGRGRRHNVPTVTDGGAIFPL